LSKDRDHIDDAIQHPPASATQFSRTARTGDAIQQISRDTPPLGRNTPTATRVLLN
jgi:hypothetical protein